MHALSSTIALAVLSLAAIVPALAGPSYPAIDHAGATFHDKDWYQQCKRVATLTPPEPRSSRPAEASCKASGLYYAKRSQAVTSAAEWEQVRECAAASGATPVLMMLYANGFGVERDADRAIHYACATEYVAEAEVQLWVEHLSRQPDSGKPFEQCDYATSGRMGAICADVRETGNERTRRARLDRLTRSLPRAGQQAFSALQRAAESYAASVEGEVDMQGTGAPGFATNRHGRRREQFMQAAMDAMAGKLPPATASDLAARDSELNDIYRKVMNAPSEDADAPARIANSRIDRNEVRKAERLWIAYRDAFVAYAASLPSRPDPLALKTLLTSQRIDELSRVARYL